MAGHGDPDGAYIKGPRVPLAAGQILEGAHRSPAAACAVQQHSRARAGQGVYAARAVKAVMAGGARSQGQSWQAVHTARAVVAGGACSQGSRGRGCIQPGQS